jgi:peroxiredoxin
MEMRAVLLVAILQLAPAAEPLRSACFADAREIGTVIPLDQLEVQSALAGDGPTCYHVRVIQPSGTLTGYILGDSLPAIQRFIKRREHISEEEARAEARRAREAAPVKPSAAEQASGAADPLINTEFEDFAGRDALGKPVSLSGMHGRATIVTFWSPGDANSLSVLEQELPLYNEFHKNGLALVGVCTNPRADIAEVLDDVSLPWPQMNDREGLAGRYKVSPKGSKTFVLDADHRIVAAGSMGPEINKAVQKLLADPANQ